MLYLEIFDRHYVTNSPMGGINYPRDLADLRRQYTHNKETIMHYYMSRDIAVKNTHILSRLIGGIPLDLNTDTLNYVYLVKNEINYLGKTFQFTSALDKGLVHPPYFYGNGGVDIVLTEFDSFNAEQVALNWKTTPCINTVLHNKNDLSLLLPFGNDDGSRGGISVVSVDLLKLAIKYREFEREQSRRVADGGTRIGKNLFIGKYVLSGFLETDIDFRILNRLMDRFYGNPIVTPRYKHKFPINDPVFKVDRFIDEILQNITSKDMSFMDIMFNIPLLFHINAADLLSFEHIANTRQSNWALLTSRLKFMCFLCDIAKNNSRNTGYLNDWKLMIKRIQRDQAMLGNFPSQYQKEIKGYLQKISNM